MSRLNKSWLLRIGIVAVGAAAIYVAWQYLRPKELGDGFVGSNGRIEAVEIYIATKIPGRVSDIRVKEGAFVKAGQVLANMNTEVLAAQRREAEAQLQRALIGVVTAQSRVKQREAENAAALAVVAQREAQLEAAGKRLERSRKLVPKGAVSIQVHDDNLAAFQGAKAALSAAKAQLAAAGAAIGTAKSQVIGAKSAVEAVRATIQRIQADINDSALKSPRDGRVQYRIAQPGEVLSAGGRVLNLVDLGDVYMTFFLPTAAAGRVVLGSEVHLVLDAVPQYVIPAKVSYVANVAQFTPKTVETASERQKLMFRIKARIDPALLKKHIRSVKTGLPGMAYVRLDPRAEWPVKLRVKLPQ